MVNLFNLSKLPNNTSILTVPLIPELFIENTEIKRCFIQFPLGINTYTDILKINAQYFSITERIINVNLSLGITQIEIWLKKGCYRLLKKQGINFIKLANELSINDQIPIYDSIKNHTTFSYKLSGSINLFSIMIRLKDGLRIDMNQHIISTSLGILQKTNDIGGLKYNTFIESNLETNNEYTYDIILSGDYTSSYSDTIIVIYQYIHLKFNNDYNLNIYQIYQFDRIISLQKQILKKIQ